MNIGTVFISHKHKDHAIAKVLADFLETSSGKRVGVFVSSDPSFEGPRLGGDLDQALLDAIGESGVVVLLYTGRGKKIDWDYCIHECSSAKSLGLRLIVLQFGDEAPAPFKHQVGARVEKAEDVQKFVQEFLTGEDFFREQTEKVTEFAARDPKVEEEAKKLHSALNEAFQASSQKEPREWSAWPWIRIRFEKKSLDKIEESGPDDRMKTVRECLLEDALIVRSKLVDGVFGVGVDPGQAFDKLIGGWRESRSEAGEEWLDSLSHQLGEFMNSRFPELRDVRILEALGPNPKQLVPVVTRTLRYPDALEADIDFYDIQPPTPRVREAMVPKEEMYYETLDAGAESARPLEEVYDDMKDKSIFRLPILDSEARGRFTVHRSVILEFMWERGRDTSTLLDLLREPGKQAALQQSVNYVAPEESLEDALRRMGGSNGVRDLFVTTTGDSEGEVVGLLTNTDIQESL